MFLITQTAVIAGQRYQPLFLCRKFENQVGHFAWQWSGDKAHAHRFPDQGEAMLAYYAVVDGIHPGYDYAIEEETEPCS
jgi:hypothetical protein